MKKQPKFDALDYLIIDQMIIIAVVKAQCIQALKEIHKKMAIERVQMAIQALHVQERIDQKVERMANRENY